MTGGIDDACEGRRGPTGTAHRVPTSLDVNRRAAIIGGHVRISALASDYARDAVLIARSGLIRAEVATASTVVVNLIYEVAFSVAIEMCASDRNHIGRRARINTHAQAGIAGGREEDDFLVRKVLVPPQFLADFRVAPAHADHSASSGGHKPGGQCDR